MPLISSTFIKNSLNPNESRRTIKSLLLLPLFGRKNLFLNFKWIIAFLAFIDPSNHLGSYAVSLIAFFILENSNHLPPTFLWGRAAYFRIS